MTMSAPVTHLALAATQHQELRRRLREQDSTIDDETLADTVEGLTDLHDILRAVMRASLSDEALAFGLKWRIEEMQTRLKRFEARAEARRSLVRDCMVEAEIKTLTAPDFTVSLRAGSPAVTVIEEAVIPDAFWQPLAPRINRQALLADLKRGLSIPGVELSNAAPTISVRTK